MRLTCRSRTVPRAASKACTLLTVSLRRIQARRAAHIYRMYLSASTKVSKCGGRAGTFVPAGVAGRRGREEGRACVLYKPASFGYVYQMMRGTAVLAVIIATLGSGGDADARPLDGPATAVRRDAHMNREGQAGKARRSRARKRRKAATSASTKTRRTQAPPASQPAHMAPQLEDIPPVKPPKTKPPKPDIRNPAQ